MCSVCQRMWSVFQVALAIAMLCVVSDWAFADEIDESDVRRWVVRLDADRKADRQRAEEELLKLGPPALKWLPEPESLGSRATAEAIRRVRAKLERQKAEASVHATRLTAADSRSVGDDSCWGEPGSLRAAEGRGEGSGAGSGAGRAEG